jgi:biotin carboxylase
MEMNTRGQGEHPVIQLTIPDMRSLAVALRREERSRV